MSDTTPNMVWTKEAERNLILCLWFADTAPDRKIETSKWAKITQDFCRIQGRRVNTTALQTRVNLLKNSFAAVSNQPSPATSSGNARPEEKGHNQVPVRAGDIPRANSGSARLEEKGHSHSPARAGGTPRHNSSNARLEEDGHSQARVGAGGAPRAMKTDDHTQTSLYRPSLYHPGLYIPGPYHVGPDQYHEPPMAHGDYTYAHPCMHHGAMSPGGTGHGEMPGYGPRFRGDAGEDTASPKYTYPSPK